MKHLAAYLLLGLGGNSSPSKSDIKSVLDSVGIEADDDRLSKLLEELDSKDIQTLITEGSGKLSSLPTGGAGGGGGGGGAASGAAAGAAGADADKADDSSKAKEKEEEKEESDEDMGLGLFD